METSAVLTAISALKSVLDIWDKLKGNLPESSEKVELVEKLEQAKKATQMAEADAAKALGYHLCQCTWPPQIMLSIGYADEGTHECFKCPSCHKVKPNPSRPTRARVDFF